MSKAGIFKQLIELLMKKKKFWMLPIVVVFVLVGMLLVAAQGSVVAPFIYTLF